MTDGVTGTNSYANPAWTAVWYNDTFHIDFDLEEHTNVYQVRVHMLAGTAGIFYPSKLSVSVSDDGTTWTEVKELTNTEQPAEASVRWFEIDGIDAAGRYVRLSITYDPTVRDGEGTNMFLSEVEIYE